MPGLPSGTVTFLFTDLGSSTRLWEEQPERMQPAPDAIEIDTTQLEVDDVVERIEALVRERTAV